VHKEGLHIFFSRNIILKTTRYTGQVTQMRLHKKCIHNFSQNAEWKRQLRRYTHIDGRIILIWIIEKCAELISLAQQSSCRSHVTFAFQYKASNLLLAS
jgi:hypothetical protein